jgi:hypothetical protein
MKRLIQLNLLLLLISSATAQETQPQQPPKILHIFDWKDLSAQFTNCQIVSMDGIPVLKIENSNDKPLRVGLLTITNSKLIQRANSFEWEMKYENIRLPDGFSLPPMMMYFSSTENSIFGMGNTKLTNYPNVCLFEKFPPQAAGGDTFTNYHGEFFEHTENWRKYYFAPHRAPYDNQTRSDELKLEIFLPSSGTVYLRPIKLMGVVSSWWSPPEAGLIGGIGGSVIGCFGALLGILASKGKARNFVLTTMKIFIALGILLTIAGFIAVVSNQPYAVWYALLLPGVILTLVFSLTLPSIQRRYDELEIRRMTSVDAMGS